MTTPAAIFYDGLTARPRIVTVALDLCQLLIREDDTILARWPYADLQAQDAPSGILRLSASSAPELARLDIADPALAAKIRRNSPSIGHAQRTEHIAKMKFVGWSSVAAISLILSAIYFVPLAADYLTPLIPESFERHLGKAVDSQVRGIFGGNSCSTTDGIAALSTLERQLLAGAPPGMQIDLHVLPSLISNAFALPGGRVYLLRGIIENAESAEEIAGVLAHEMGHIAQRDGLRRLIQSSGSSILIGLLFGDVFGTGVLTAMTQTLINSAYSREQENAADGFAADLFLAIGQSPKPLGVLLTRISKSEKAGIQNLRILLDHPLSEERLAALTARGEPATPAPPLLSEAEWRALKNICPPAADKSPK